MAAKPKNETENTSLEKPAAPGEMSTEVMSEEQRKQMLADLAADGMDFDREDLAIPFLRLAQDMTPQTKKIEAAHIPGLEPGDLFHTVTGQFWKNPTGVLVTPVAFTRSFTEWTLREKGSGFLKDHGSDGSLMDQCTRDEKNRDITPQGTQLVRAALYYVLLINEEDGTFQQAALSLTGTQLKHAKKWNALITQYKMRGIPGYGKLYRLTSVVEKNQQYSWHVIHVTPGENTLSFKNGQSIYDAAKQYADLVRTGAVTANMKNELGGEGDDDGGTMAGGEGAARKNVPF